jgi:hypothetical protein
MLIRFVTIKNLFQLTTAKIKTKKSKIVKFKTKIDDGISIRYTAKKIKMFSNAEEKKNERIQKARKLC